MKSLLDKTVKELREYFLFEDLAVSEETLTALERDSRSAVQQLARRLRHQKLRREQENARLEQLLQFETELWKRGYARIAGVDEAGMAPLAGPVVAAALSCLTGIRLKDWTIRKRYSMNINACGWRRRSNRMQSAGR
jgi:ribonuclease HII